MDLQLQVIRLERHVATLGDRYGFPSQREIAFVGGIAPQYIRAVRVWIITGYSGLG